MNKRTENKKVSVLRLTPFAFTLHLSKNDKLLFCFGHVHAAVRLYDDEILDTNSELAFKLDARLYSDYGLFRKDILTGGGSVGILVYLDANAVTQRVSEGFAIALRSNVVS